MCSYSDHYKVKSPKNLLIVTPQANAVLRNLLSDSSREVLSCQELAFLDWKLIEEVTPSVLKSESISTTPFLSNSINESTSCKLQVNCYNYLQGSRLLWHGNRRGDHLFMWPFGVFLLFGPLLLRKCRINFKKSKQSYQPISLLRTDRPHR